MSDKDAAADIPIPFRGLPQHIGGLVPGNFDRVVAAVTGVQIIATEPMLANFAIEKPYLRVGRSGSIVTPVSFSLPEATPAGVYAGTIELDGVKRPIEITVEARSSLTIFPRRLSLTGTSGGKTTAEFTVTNQGNAEGTVPQAVSLDLVHAEALSSAFLAMLRREAGKSGMERINTFAEELHNNYAGMLRIEVENGPLRIAYGQTQHCVLQLQFPDNLRAGETYRAEWVLEKRPYIVEVVVPEGSAVPASRPARPARRGAD